MSLQVKQQGFRNGMPPVMVKGGQGRSPVDLAEADYQRAVQRYMALMTGEHASAPGVFLHELDEARHAVEHRREYYHSLRNT